MKITIDYENPTSALERVQWQFTETGDWVPTWVTNGHAHNHKPDEPQQVLWEVALTLKAACTDNEGESS
jgi:hypothetical protein